MTSGAVPLSSPASPVRPRPYLTIRARRGWKSINWRELWMFRDLLLSLTARDIKLRYKQTVLGVAWVLLQPLVASGILVFVFGHLGKMSPDKTMSGQYIPAFLFTYASMLVWNLFAGIVTKGSGILVSNATLVSKVYFPRLLLPVSSALAAFVDLGVASCALVIMQLWVGVPFGPQVLFAPVILLMMVSVALGISLWAGALCVRYRDVGHIVPVAVNFLLFASPVAYSISVVHGKTGAFVYQLNPLSGIIGLWRWTVLGTPFPQVWTVWSAAGISIGLLVMGTMVFRRCGRCGRRRGFRSACCWWARWFSAAWKGHSPMSSSDLSVSVRDVSKRYTLMHKGARFATLGEKITETMRHPFRRAQRESFWALKDFNFDIFKGEVVGFVGRNGAGKSTLLKILSRITEPTTGVIDLYGRVGSLLEIGTGFHPELTGRENIFLNGAILGMRRREIQKQFDAIIDFAGVEKFLDTPVKRFSSGMYIRLAFAVAAHLNPEILIVDEVLSVGDAEFQKKCLGKMQDVARGEGRTVLFVSHNMAAVRQLCSSAIYLEKGRIVRHGPTAEVMDLYTASRQRAPLLKSSNDAGLSFIDLALIDEQTGARTEMPVFNRDFLLRAKIRADQPLAGAALRLSIFDESGTKVSSIYSSHESGAALTLRGDAEFTYRLPRLALYPGRYSVNLAIARPNDPRQYLGVEDALVFEVQPAFVGDAMWAYDKSHGLARISEEVPAAGERDFPPAADTGDPPAGAALRPAFVARGE